MWSKKWFLKDYTSFLNILSLCCHVFFVLLQASAWSEIHLEWLLRLSIMTQDFSCPSMSNQNSTRKETCIPLHLRYTFQFLIWYYMCWINKKFDFSSRWYRISIKKYRYFADEFLLSILIETLNIYLTNVFMISYLLIVLGKYF